jgi:membrane associated rhomboid family serine protease
MIKITNTVKHLIIINVIFYVATIALKGNFGDLMAMHYPANSNFKPWQIITHMFMHGGEMHLLFNMLGLWMFGSAIEQMLGRNNFLILFFLSGLGAIILYTGIDYFQFNNTYTKLVESGLTTEVIQGILDTGQYNEDWLGQVSKSELRSFYSKYNTPLVGASGALYGVLVAFGVLQPKAKMGLMFLPIMIEARYFIPLLLLGDIFFGVFSLKGDNIAHFAHVGGAIAGFLLIWQLKKHNFKRWF